MREEGGSGKGGRGEGGLFIALSFRFLMLLSFKERNNSDGPL